MKKTIISAFAVGLIFTQVSVFADSDDIKIPSSPQIDSVLVVKENEEVLPARTTLSKLKERGDRAIRERINSLNTNKKIIEENKNLLPAQKTAITTLITTNITGLTTLRSTLASSTDATSTRALIGTITKDFRIYAIVIPQVRLEKRIYDLANHADKLSATFLKVQTKIDEAKAKGNDVTVWQKSLDDAKITVANDMFTITTTLTKVQALKPADYGTSSKMIIEEANKSMKAVAKDFNSIAKTLHRPHMMKKMITNASSTKNESMMGGVR